MHIRCYPTGFFHAGILRSKIPALFFNLKSLFLIQSKYVIFAPMKSITRLIFILIIIGLVSYGIYYVIKTSTNTNEVVLKPAIISLILEKPNFLIKGKGLARVEVWAVPTGTEITESSYIKIGIAELKKVDDKEQVWLIPIPRQPLLLTEIFAKGFDEKGNLVGKVSLPIVGASDIYKELWLEAPQQSLFLKVGESGIAGEVTVKVVKIVSDSRCASDVVCIQAGNVVVELEVTKASKIGKLSIATDEDGKPFEGYFIQIMDVLPEAKSTVKIEEKDYTITVSVLKDVKL